MKLKDVLPGQQFYHVETDAFGVRQIFVENDSCYSRMRNFSPILDTFPKGYVPVLMVDDSLTLFLREEDEVKVENLKYQF